MIDAWPPVPLPYRAPSIDVLIDDLDKLIDYASKVDPHSAALLDVVKGHLVANREDKGQVSPSPSSLRPSQ